MVRVQSQPGPDTTGICSLCHRAFMGSIKSSRQVRRQSVFTKISRCILPLLCFLPLLSCPFIVRSAQTRQPFTGFTQLASMFTINADNCLFLCSCLQVCSPVTRSIIGSSPSSCSGVWDPWSVEYQSCKLAMLLQY